MHTAEKSGGIGMLIPFLPIILFKTAYAAQMETLLMESSGFMELYKGLLGISSGLSVAAIAVCLARYMASGDARCAADAARDGKHVVLAWILINMLGAVLASVASLISGIEL